MRYTTPPSPVEAFRRVSSKIGRKTANSNEDDSNHRLLDHSSWDQSDELRDDDILPFNPAGKFQKKTAPLSLSNFGTLKSPRSMKTLMSRVNAVVEHNSYFGNHESRDDDESNVGLLSRDGQYETRYENRWSDAGEDDESYAMQTSQSNNGATTTQPLLPDLVDLGGFSDSSESAESSEENEGANATVMTSDPDDRQDERDGSSFSNKQSLDYIVESVEEVTEESQEEVAVDDIVDTSSTIDFDDEEETRVTAASAKPASLDLNEDSEIEQSIELEGSSSTVDFDDDLPLAAEHPESIVQDQAPVEVEEVEEESERKSVMSSPTDTKSYVSYSRNECPVVVSSSEYGDVILLSPKGFENIVTAEATPSVSTENEQDSQDLSKKFEAIALADPSMISRQNFARATDQAKNDRHQQEMPKADSDDEDEFVISDDWSEDNSVGNSSDPFGEYFVNEAAVQTITEHRQEDNTTSIGREKIAEEEEVGATNDDEPTENSRREPLPEASIQLADLETSQLTNKSSSSTDLASFNQIWEGSAKMSESGSDSEECDESRIGNKMSNDDDASLVVSRELIAGFKNELSTSGSSEDDKVVSSDSEEKDSFVSLNNYWSSEWNELTLDDSTNRTKRVQASALNEEDVEEDIEVHDKYSTAHDEDDSDDFYGCGIVEGSYSYDSYGLETISEEEEEEFEDDESARSGSRIGVENSETLIPIDESKKQLSVETEELVSQEADKNGEEVKECNSVDLIDAEEDVTAATKSSDATTREVILVETVNEDSSAEDESRDEEEVVQTTTSNHDLGVQSEVVQNEVLHQLWTQIDEYQASGNTSADAVEQAPRQTPTKAIIPVKKHAVVKHSMRDRSPSPRAKKAGSSTDRTFDDLSKFLDGEDDNDASLDYLETSSNATEVLLDDGSDKIDAEMKRTSVKRHVFTRLFAPVSALVTRRRGSQQQDLGPTSSGAIFKDGSQEAACDDDNVESDDDRQARELTELLSAAMMARDLEKMNKSAASAKHVAEIREAMAIEQELAEIEGDLHYENSSSSDEDDSQIEILDEEIVTVPPTDASSNVESKELHDLWTKIDEYHANGKSLNTTQVSMMAELLNSQMEEQQTSENAVVCKSSTRPLRTSKHAVSVKKRAVVNAKAKKSKYDVSYIEAKSIVKKNNAIEEVVVDLVSAPERSDNYEPSDEIKCPEEPSLSLIDLETNDEIKCPEEPSQPLIDLETQDTYESADLDDPPQLCLIPSAMSINSFASIVSEDESSESSLGDVSKAKSDTSKGSSLVSKLYSDNADLAETLATTQCELEKALKQIETMRMEKESQEKVVQSKPAPSPKSSFDEYFEEDMISEEGEGEI